jgi:hypothetical protein
VEQCFLEINKKWTFIFKVNKCFPSLHDKHVVVPADKASNSIIFVKIIAMSVYG